MSTSAVVPAPIVDFGASSAAPAQQSVLSQLLGQLKQSVSAGDLTGARTLLTAVDALSPSSAVSGGALGSFLTGVGQALEDGSVSEAQSALATYGSASSAADSSAAQSSTGAKASSIASGLVLSQVQLSLVSSLLGGGGTADSGTSSSSFDSLLGILNQAYGEGAESSGANSGSPYETLVAAIQSSLDAGKGTAGTALAYLDPKGNFVDVNA